MARYLVDTHCAEKRSRCRELKRPGAYWSPGEYPEQKDPVPLSRGQSLRLFDRYYRPVLENFPLCNH
ncbi:hypothetical protein FKN05_00975 [Vibrio sp. 1-1(7)]|nr:hypothetical protein [Vibrio sp. 1-1(7)]NNN71091.1 hypothetical protein [Vibrio sp. 12-2(3-a)]